MRASHFLNKREKIVIKQEKEQPAVAASVVPPKDLVEKAQVLVSNYISREVEKTGQEPVVVVGTVKKPRIEETPEEEEEEPPIPACLLESRGTSKALVDIAARHPEATVIQDTGARAHVEALYEQRLKTNGRTIDELVASVPTPQECAANVERISGAVPKDSTTKVYVSIAIDKNLEIPRIESLDVSDVADFLRPPDPDVAFERPCKPLIDKATNAPSVCESVQMGRGVLREFLLPSMVHAKQLPKLQRCCWLCLQKFVTVEWARRRAKTTDADKDDEWRVILHDYEMVVNRPGGFNGDVKIPRDKKACGIAGDVLMHDRTLYLPKTFQDRRGKPLQGWKMADQMLFRPGATNEQ